MSSDNVENNDNTCVVCFKSVDIYSVGNCDHMVCYECSTRMRVLCRQNECPICRQDLPKVIFINSLKSFNEIKSHNYYEDKKYKILFQNKQIQQAFHRLLEHTCSICSNKLFKTFHQLYDHMKREHDLYYCDLCVEHLKIFTFERRCYNKTDLVQHKKKGDQDDKSHRGHPLCEFCQTRFMDNDFLYRHLRKDHLFCHFCDADGINLYYSSYDYLRDHFREEHYLCEEGACIDEKFTPVFRTDIDFKAHKMAAHGRALSKGAAKQARMLELEFTVKPRSKQLESDYKFRTVDTRFQNSSPSEGAAALVQDSPPRSHSPTLDINDFPSLPSGSGTVTVTSVPQRQVRTGALTIQAIGRRNAPLAMNDENFPALGNYNENSQGTSVKLNINQDRNLNNGRSHMSAPSRNVSIHVNHKLTGEQNIKIKQDDFPALPSDSRASSLSSAKWAPALNKNKTANSAAKQERHPKSPASGDDFPELSTRFSSNLNLKSKEPSKPNYGNIRSSKGDEKNTRKATSVLIPVREDGLDISEASTSNQKAKIKKKKSKTNIMDEKSDTAKEKDDKETIDNSQGIHENVKNKSGTSSENSGSSTKLVKPLPTVEDWFGDEKKLRSKPEGKDDEISVFYKSRTSSGPSGDEGAKGIDLENFKSNISGFPAVKRDIKTPPGFDNLNGLAKSKPPPGFGIGFPCSNDLTFTNSSGESFAIPTNYNYIPPPNFEKRNKNLVKKMFQILSNDSNLEQFKRMSGLFRHDMLSADEYCNHCIQTMGEDGFQAVFPELLILLPDIKKQQELYKVLSRSSKSELVKNKLQICETCRQVLCKSNVEEHADQHAMQENFPFLRANNYT